MRFFPVLCCLCLVSCGEPEEPTPCDQLLEIFAGCGYLTESLPGMPEHQEPLQQMEAGTCGEDLH